jgi:gliding motility-associated-like protein
VSIKNDIQAFDQIFKNQLEEASVNPPVGLWESIAPQTAPLKTVTTASKWGATWLKTLLISGTLGISSLLTYKYYQTKPKIKQNYPIVSEEIVKQPNISMDETIPELVEIKNKKLNTDKKSIPNNVLSNLSDLKKEVIRDDEKTNDIVKESILNSGILNIPKNIIPSIINSTQINENIATEEENGDLMYILEKSSTFEEENKITVVNSDINIPNVVTPNGDGLNDTYFVEIQGEEYFEMVIYNSKMEKLFETKSKNKAWDCKLPNGEFATSGNYTVFLKYKFHNQEIESQYIKLKVIK